MGLSSENEMLLDLAQKQAVRYFLELGKHGLASERSNIAFGYGPEILTLGGSGMGVMALIVATERRWISRRNAVMRLLEMLTFLEEQVTRYRGMFPHYIHEDGKTVPIMEPADNGGDLVETAFLFQGLICARQYFDRKNPKEAELRSRITELWGAVDWNWYTRKSIDSLYWHWSPNFHWKMNHKISGWNECLIAYVMAASSPTHAIDPAVYHSC